MRASRVLACGPHGPLPALLLGLLVGCAASNPRPADPGSVRLPTAAPPAAADEGPGPGPGSGGGSGADTDVGRSGAPSTAAADRPAPDAEPDEPADRNAGLAARSSDGDDRVPLPIAFVGGEPIDVRTFLVRAWFDSNGAQRRLLETIIFERLVQLEAERLGVRLDPDEVEGTLALAYEALEERMREAGAVLTLEEFIAQVLGYDPAFFGHQMRADAVVQALMSRCVRAHSLASDHAIVRLLSVGSEEEAKAIEARLQEGEAFADVAVELAGSSGEGEPTILLKSEASEIARRAFATASGTWTGPWLESGRYLFLSVERFVDAHEGSNAALLRAVEEDLPRFPLHNLEITQWQVAMSRRYSIDRRPFADIVEGR